MHTRGLLPGKCNKYGSLTLHIHIACEIYILMRSKGIQGYKTVRTRMQIMDSNLVVVTIQQ